MCVCEYLFVYIPIVAQLILMDLYVLWVYIHIQICIQMCVHTLILLPEAMNTHTL